MELQEPVIEEIDPVEYKTFKEKTYKGKKFLGYYFNCIECNKEGYLHNKNQLFCPRCGVPFHFDGLGVDDKLSRCYEEVEKVTQNFDQPQFIEDVENAFKHIIEEDIITDMEET